MIVVEFSEPEGSKVRLKVSGHSGTAQKGEDIVCSAISTLVQTLAGGIQNNLSGSVRGKLLPGDCDLEIVVKNENAQALKLVCDVFRFGFQKVFESYPEHVKLN